MVWCVGFGIYQLPLISTDCCALPDTCKRYLSHGMLPLSGHDDVALFNDVTNGAESTQK